MIWLSNEILTYSSGVDKHSLLVLVDHHLPAIEEIIEENINLYSRLNFSEH